jgi:hypothetical protein
MTAVLLMLAACSSNKNTPDLAAGDPLAGPPPMALPSGPLTAAQINNALKERTFSYVSGSRQGKITYFADGTFSYEEAGKGQGTGLWQASDNKLCEARNPTSFLPKGTPSSCSPFSANGTVFTAGNMELTPA